jgi:hypothetical protein
MGYVSGGRSRSRHSAVNGSDTQAPTTAFLLTRSHVRPQHLDLQRIQSDPAV